MNTGPTLLGRVQRGLADLHGGATSRRALRLITRNRNDTRVDLYHYRTRDQVEVDAVLENRRGEVVGIEVKASSTPRSDDFRGLRHLQDRLGDDFIAGVVLHTGQHTLPFGPKLRAMPISALWELEP